MRALGIAVRHEAANKRPTTRGVLLDDSSGSPVIIDKFEISADDVDLATQLHDLAEATRSRLAALAPDQVVLVRADFSPAASRQEAPKLRLLAEGAAASAARDKVEATFVCTGQEAAGFRGTDKDGLKAESRSLVNGGGLPYKWEYAAAAALAALSHP